MLNVVSENSPMGQNALPRFVKTPSRYIIEFENPQEEEEEDDDALIRKVRAQLLESLKTPQHEDEVEYEYVYEEEDTENQQ